MTIYFYEWSNINERPILFTELNDFVTFCENANIKITERTRSFLNSHETIYIACKKGSHNLIMGSSERGFRKNFMRSYNR